MKCFGSVSLYHIGYIHILENVLFECPVDPTMHCYVPRKNQYNATVTECLGSVPLYCIYWKMYYLECSIWKTYYLEFSMSCVRHCYVLPNLAHWNIETKCFSLFPWYVPYLQENVLFLWPMDFVMYWCVPPKNHNKAISTRNTLVCSLYRIYCETYYLEFSMECVMHCNVPPDPEQSNKGKIYFMSSKRCNSLRYLPTLALLQPFRVHQTFSAGR